MNVRLERFSFISPEGLVIPQEEWTCQSIFGIKWVYQGKEHLFDFGYAIQSTPLPSFDGFVIVFPYFHKSPFQLPDNAAVYNCDGTLRFRLKAPKPLSRHLPGYVHTPEHVEQLDPEGFSQVGRGYGDGITDATRPWMWAYIDLWYDVYERRYFDPTTGEFDLQHFSTFRL